MWVHVPHLFIYFIFVHSFWRANVFFFRLMMSWNGILSLTLGTCLLIMKQVWVKLLVVIRYTRKTNSISLDTTGESCLATTKIKQWGAVFLNWTFEVNVSKVVYLLLQTLFGSVNGSLYTIFGLLCWIWTFLTLHHRKCRKHWNSVKIGHNYFYKNIWTNTVDLPGIPANFFKPCKC